MCLKSGDWRAKYLVSDSLKRYGRPKVAGRDMPLRNWAKRITINEDVVASREKASSDSDDIYATHLTTSESEGEHHDLRATNSNPKDGDLLAAQRAELRSKRMNDSSRIRTPQATTTSSAPAQVVVLTPPLKGPSPRSMNRLKTEGLMTIIKEKRLYIDGVIDRYPAIHSTPRLLCSKLGSGVLHCLWSPGATREEDGSQIQAG
uniref:Integrase core domain containing protein n=1 Tax=Solanum tuberosum TaxID=4113 RepID=M1DZV2_SOLTU